MDGLVDSEASYCAEQGLQMRQQPHYRYPAELIEASGHLQRPETEFSRRSFDPIAYPHKLTVSGAQLYPSNAKRWVSAEAFTFLNDKYRTTMEQIKQATDAFLRDGIGQFYNHGYFYSPEKELAPSRDLIWMNRISHVNTWWPYYRGLADYQARATFLARQGRAVADVLVYSPMTTVWSEQASFEAHDRVRNVPFGPLPKLLVAGGYDFDCVNDDLLQHAATIQDGQIAINGYRYSVLILPRILTLAPETLAVIERFVRAGGTVFALETLPARSDTLVDHETRDQAVAAALQRLFNSQAARARQVGPGWTYFLPGCDGFVPSVFSPRGVDWTPTAAPSPAYAEFLADLKARLVPDFEIAGTPLSNVLTFRHTRIGPVDAWFVCNLQPNAQAGPVTLKTPRPVRAGVEPDDRRDSFPARCPSDRRRAPRARRRFTAVGIDLCPHHRCAGRLPRARAEAAGINLVPGRGNLAGEFQRTRRHAKTAHARSPRRLGDARRPA